MTARAWPWYVGDGLPSVGGEIRGRRAELRFPFRQCARSAERKSFFLKYFQSSFFFIFLNFPVLSFLGLPGPQTLRREVPGMSGRYPVTVGGVEVGMTTRNS
ncbi:hypothetical protein TNIN_48861 [Trichonephila inaurata madagascariensis]|uniref:Uncharacterized protein n=1 Tax=Trichonephila inaurata madagascariensis TaxID=2747483 RepID=A0A8X6YMB3_9ARAC|nr:hypothetical protein TNIN_48861 [Trichonephila inaurata madagascariensis]